MINDIVRFLKFLFDPQTRNFLNSISSILWKGDRWEKEIHYAKAKFRGDQSHEVTVFANNLLAQMKDVGVSKRERDSFRAVFTELIRNAFQHGCKESKQCRVTVRCAYSTWFIHLEISDTGGGFDYQEAIARSSTQIGTQNVPHGLLIAESLSHSMRIEKSGRQIRVLLCQPMIKVSRSTLRYRGKEILLIHLTQDEHWNYSSYSWEPLAKILGTYTHQLVLVDCVATFWDTATGSGAAAVIKPFQGKAGFYYAFIVEAGDADRYGLHRLEYRNVRVFEEENESWDAAALRAKRWLVEQTSKSPKIEAPDLQS